jgi:hypothetical protein
LQSFFVHLSCFLATTCEQVTKIADRGGLGNRLVLISLDYTKDGLACQARQFFDPQFTQKTAAQPIADSLANWLARRRRVPDAKNILPGELLLRRRRIRRVLASPAVTLITRLYLECEFGRFLCNPVERVLIHDLQLPAELMS